MTIREDIQKAIETLRDSNVPLEFVPIPLVPSQYDYLEKQGTNMMYFSRMEFGK